MCPMIASMARAATVRPSGREPAAAKMAEPRQPQGGPRSVKWSSPDQIAIQRDEFAVRAVDGEQFQEPAASFPPHSFESGPFG